MNQNNDKKAEALKLSGPSQVFLMDSALIPMEWTVTKASAKPLDMKAMVGD